MQLHPMPDRNADGFLVIFLLRFLWTSRQGNAMIAKHRTQHIVQFTEYRTNYCNYIMYITCILNEDRRAELI